MADASYRFQQGAGQHFYSQFGQQSHHPRHLPQRNGSPVNSARIGFNPDAPSPNRSPAPQSPATHTHYNNMFNQANVQHNQHVMMNGGAAHQRFAMPMNLNKAFQHHGHQQQTHPHQAHQDHHAGGHGAQFGNHQHTMSGSSLSNPQGHFTPNHVQIGTPGSVHSGLSKPPNEHWAEQLTMAQNAREMTIAHSHARNHPSVNKQIIAGTSNGNSKETNKEERNRATIDPSEDDQDKQIWTSLDLGGQSLKVVAPALFNYTFLTKLYLNYNKLTYISPIIGRLRALTHLDLSLNEIRTLPGEIGMLVRLKQLLLFDNHLETLPYEMGSLYQLEMLGIEGNPLHEELKTLVVENGTQELIKYFRENAAGPDPPAERDWVILDDSPVEDSEKITVMSYNSLCDMYCTQSQYGYTPSRILDWDSRKEVILDELRERSADFICLQEVDAESFNDYFRPALAHNDYKGVFWPKSRARTMGEREAKAVDGCATFYKNSKYILLDKQLIDFANTAINRPDMKGEHDIFNRVMPKDQISVVTFFENRQTGARIIVVNAHVFWDPKFKDVKLIQVAILLEQVTKLAEKYAKWPACKDKELFRYSNGESDEPEPPKMIPGPSLEYTNGASIPLVMCGDFNSLPNSGVYELISQGTLPPTHSDLAGRKYGNFTRDGMSHPFSLKSSYSHIGELSFTNYTVPFTGVIDYIWYSTNTLQVGGLLGEVDKEYLQKVPGFPNYHFPSDHLALLTEFMVKSRKEKKVVEADFGPQRDRKG